jgi:NADPH:quinone reductase-like Zn-dependent oxidoreductase
LKSWKIIKFGIDNLEQAEVAIPELSPGKVLIRVHAVSLNYRDLMVVKGLYNPRMELPRIPCSDGAGEVVAVGAEVARWKVGDRVAGIFMQNWIDGPANTARQRGALGGDIDGMAAEFVALDQDGLVAIPEHLSYEEAATLPCAAVTAWNAVVNVGNIRPGDTVVIQGTGGVSIFALQFAKLLGARVLGTSGSDDKLHRAKRDGLDDGVNYKLTHDWASWVIDHTSGQGADLVVEVGGAGTLQQSLKAVRIGGVVAQIGVLTGVEQPLQISPILHKQIQMRGIYVGSRSDFERMNRAISQSQLRPIVDNVFAFNDFKESLQRMESASHYGKIVVRV